MEVYQPGMMIGNYEIVSKPMMGGMGAVYFAIDHGNDSRPVAIKTFRPELLPDRTARDRFLREGVVWVELGNHPHIVRCYKVEYISPVTFLILELVAKAEGRANASLRAWMDKPISIRHSLIFALQIARGMQFAAQKIPGFVHRDLKPENMLVGEEILPDTDINLLRVTDFGLATILRGDSVALGSSARINMVGDTRLTNGILGTPRYMAPEQQSGNTVGIFTDVYAFGCILYEMIIGLPVNSNPKFDLLSKNLSVDFVRFLKKCLAKDASERYSNWDTLIAALEDIYLIECKCNVPQALAPKSQIDIEQSDAGWSYNAIGTSYKNMGKVKDAIRYYERSLTVMRKTGNQHGEGVVLGNLGSSYLNLGDFRRSISYNEQSLKIAQKIGNQYGEGAALGNLGIAYKNLGDVYKAIPYYEKHLEVARGIGDRIGESNALGNLGTAYYILEDLHKSIDYHSQQRAIAHEIGYLQGEGTGLGNLGIAYFSLNEFDRAMPFLEKALSIDREIGNIDGMARHLTNMASLCIQQGNSSRALTLAQEALQFWTQIGSPNIRAVQQLIAQLQTEGVEQSGFTQDNAIQSAFEAFQYANSPSIMEATVEQYPFMKEVGFIQAIEQVIKDQVPLNLKPAFDERLNWLKQIAGKQDPGFLGRLFGKK